jgi:hypothetical protein
VVFIYAKKERVGFEDGAATGGESGLQKILAKIYLEANPSLVLNVSFLLLDRSGFEDF